MPWAKHVLRDHYHTTSRGSSRGRQTPRQAHRPLTDVLDVLRPRAAPLPPLPSEEPAPPVSQGIHALLAWRTDGFSSLDIRQRYPDVLSASVG